MTRRFVVLVNAAAGSVDESAEERDEITRAFADRGIDAAVHAIDPQDLAEAMRAAWNAGAEAVIIAGGDGSVNSAANVAAGSDIVLGVLPMGTFNHFAKDLGVPTGDLSASMRGITATDLTVRRLTQALIIDADDDRLAIALDGEPTELQVPLEFRSRPGALLVLAAADQA